MDHISLLDPYEQQLLKVFNSHDIDNLGSLDSDGLTQLCQTLQLEEQTFELLKCLLSDKKQRASFGEFKDALLAMLGRMQCSKNTSDSPVKDKKPAEKSSPDREVSPKFVYGSKKYGRRSRPRTEDINSIFNEENENSPTKANGTPVQRSNSQSEVLSKKRKTNYKLKRCTSLPGRKDLNNTPDNHFITSNLSNEPDIVCTEDMLREAWKKLGVGEDGYLNQRELVLVCDAIGLHKLADEVIKQFSDELSVNYNRKISFKEVLDVIQRDETWFDVLSSNDQPVNFRSSPKELFPDSRTFQYVTLGPDGNGIINTDTLIEMWENVGIHSPKELIHELGFNSRTIKIMDLAEVLEKQTRSITETTRDEYQSPHLILLQANLSLYQSEIKCLRAILEQLQAEREKLKLDVCEANNRATMLAQEVDDNHIRMEQNTLNQVKLLEQRHADMLRDITSQYTKDKEQLGVINQSLEDKISTLETETIKLKNDMVTAQKYSLNLEKENQSLNGRICNLEKDKDVLTGRIEILEAEKQKVSEIEREESEMLLAKLTTLQIRNSELKDRNDEMESEIESLTNQVISMKAKASSTPTRSFNTLDQSMEDENISVICETGIGLGAKRRSECSPSKDIQLLRLNGSPRLGKLRKCYKSRTPENLEVPFTSSESGFDTEPESLSTCDNEEINRLQAKVAFLEQVLIQNNIPVPSYEEIGKSATTTMQLTNRVKELEKTISDVKKEINLTRHSNEGCVKCDSLRRFFDKLSNSQESNSLDSDKSFIEQSSQTDFSIAFVEEKVKKMEEENQELSAKCTELEDCVELLRNEYEKCEDYWQTKVDEERQFFEAEQKISGDKLNELLDKMREYEEQYANQDLLDGRLPPIVETENLEKQFTDLEQEFEDYRAYHESEMFRKEEEISELKDKLSELATRQEEMREVSVQADADAERQRNYNKMKTFKWCVAEITSRYPEENAPPQPSSLEFHSANWDRTTVKSETETSTSSLPPMHWSLPINSEGRRDSSSVGHGQPSTSSSQNSTPCRPKRTRKHDKHLYKKNNPEKDARKSDSAVTQQQQSQQNKGGEDNVVLPISTFNSILGRKNYLEVRIKHLQQCMKQQHHVNEQTIQYYFHQFRCERSDLHAKLKFCQEKLDQQMKICNEQLDKLHRNDLFVKDLYVENSYLFANVQRLEKQCKMLAQANNCSSSV
ncbi:blastoderm-specific protein 25D isoform X2 [Sitophilus oryzae]|uniref:Blastoderm-specific protein 25D isoform X2 n=1 Tax=Sitophilus oryzae TaxID=7048 RepID=A0A6J2Y688_SITOR|nr:blastoderm-specific protein 25D isoform X2 [Sitophilus oryzae]